MLKVLRSCDHWGGGIPLPAGFMCAVAALWLYVPILRAACPAHCQCIRRAVTCHLSIFPLLMDLAISLAEVARHCIHAIVPSSSSSWISGVLCLFVFLRHHLVKVLSVLMILAIVPGVSFQVSHPYRTLGLTSACSSLSLLVCDVFVLLRRFVFICAVFHACLVLCLSECMESPRKATS